MEIIEAEGIGLIQRGNRFWALCPFHVEKTPSFAVNPETQRFKCFGCGERGDVVDFMRKHKKLSFPEALSHLKVDCSYKKNSRQVEQAKLSKKRKEALKVWEREYAREIGNFIRIANQIDLKVKAPEDFERFNLGEVYFKRDLVTAHMEILLNNGDINLKLNLFEDVHYGATIEPQ